MDVNLAFLAAIVESSDDAIIGITPAGRIASWNSGARGIYGYTAAEVIGQPIAILSLPERQDEFAQLQASLLRCERVKHFETLHLKKSGQMLHVSLSLSPIFDGTGQLLGTSVIVRDITERLQAVEALREAEEKYHLIFAAERDAILLFDPVTGTIADFNEAALKLYDYGRDEFSRLTLQDLCNDQPPAAINKGDGAPAAINRLPLILHRRRDGSIFTAEMSVSSFVWQRRRLLVGIVRDITERERSRQLLQSLAVAREIQQHLLPRQPPAVAGLDIFARSQSCEEIGGDYYDYFTLSNAPTPWFGFTVGDVSGHGIGAALLMAMAKGLLHSEVQNCGADLARLFAGVNRRLCASVQDGSFMTLFFGLLDPVCGTLHWNSAGHGPIFWYQSRLGRMNELRPAALPLGILAEESFSPPDPVSLEPGDLLLVGTDGVWEARNLHGEMFEISRLRQLIATWAAKSSQQIHNAIMVKMHDFMQGAAAVDDMTLMVIKVLCRSAPGEPAPPP